MSGLAKPQTLRRRFFRAIPAIVLAIVATYALNWIGILNTLERFILDFQLTGKPVCPQAGVDRPCPIALVLVTDEDYDSLFGGRSPLDAGRLHDVIAAVARKNPRVIAVDIDTSHSQFRRFNPQFAGSAGQSIPIVWEREVAASGARRTGDFVPLDVLGSQDPSLNKNSGIPALLDDPVDKVTRLYMRCIKTNVGEIPSFVYAVANAYRATSGVDARPCGAGAELHPRLIRFTFREGTIDMVTAATVFEAAKAGGPPLATLQDRIVILGGTYRDFDRHFTPIGVQPGAIVLANALQTELFGPSVEAPSHWALFLLEAVAATLLVLGFHVLAWSPVSVLIGGSVLALMLAFAFSYLSYNSLSGLMTFVPTLLAVLMFEIYEHVRHRSIVQAVRPNDGHKV
jgi:CHASE2 domain-containing sensor protein